MHPGDEGGVAGLRGERQGEFGGLGGAGVGAHVHVGADDARVEEEQGVGVVEATAVELVDGGFQQVDGVAEFTGEVVGEGTSAQGGDAGGQRYVVAEGLLGLLEVLACGAQFARLHGALPEPEQGGGPHLGEVERVGLGEQAAVLRGGLLGLPGGEGALGLGEAQAQIGDETGRAAGRQFLEPDAEAVGEMPERVVGGAHPTGLQSGDVGRCVRRFGELFLCQSAFDPQLLHPSPDDARVVPLRHGQLPKPLLPFGSRSP